MLKILAAAVLSVALASPTFAAEPRPDIEVISKTPNLNSIIGKRVVKIAIEHDVVTITFRDKTSISIEGYCSPLP